METKIKSIDELFEEAKAQNRDKFKAWVYEFGGTKKLSLALNTHQNSVQNWIARRSRPNLDAVLGIIRLSMGRISLNDIDEGTELL